MRTSLARIALCTLAAAALPAVAQPAREGAIDMSFCFGGPTHAVNVSQGVSFGNYTLTGGSQSADKTFHALGMECIGTFEYKQGAPQHRGYCVWQDGGGDKIYGVDSRSPQTGYVWEFLGGTGKFQGIQGSGKVEFMGNVAQVRTGTMQGCRRLTGTYKLS
jgi:hypothetical protein